MSVLSAVLSASLGRKTPVKFVSNKGKHVRASGEGGERDAFTQAVQHRQPPLGSDTSTAVPSIINIFN